MLARPLTPGTPGTHPSRVTTRELGHAFDTMCRNAAPDRQMSCQPPPAPSQTLTIPAHGTHSSLCLSLTWCRTALSWKHSGELLNYLFQRCLSSPEALTALSAVNQWPLLPAPTQPAPCTAPYPLIPALSLALLHTHITVLGPTTLPHVIWITESCENATLEGNALTAFNSLAMQAACWGELSIKFQYNRAACHSVCGSPKQENKGIPFTVKQVYFFYLFIRFFFHVR